MLRLPAVGRPFRKRLEAVAIFPAEFEEFASIEIGGFFPEEGLEAPLDVGALPRTKTVAAGSEPIKLEHVPQGVQVYGTSFQLSLVSSQF
jgi:hypothetical protein